MWSAGSVIDKVINTCDTKLKTTTEKKPEPEPAWTELENDTFYYHNPPEITPQNDSSAPEKLPFYLAIIPPRVVAEKPAVKSEAFNPSEFKNVKHIGEWMKQGAVELDELPPFLAASTSQLIATDAKTVDKVRIIKAYIGPSTTPIPERNTSSQAANAGDEEGVEMRSITPSGPPALKPFYELNPKTVHQDLARLRGMRNFGIHVVAKTLPIKFDVKSNLSYYYKLPMLESPEEERGCYIDWMDLPNGTGVSDIEGKNYPPTLKPKGTTPTMAPAHSLIIYLAGKGKTVQSIVDVLFRLDEKWVYEWACRWFNGFRVPDHWEFDDNMVEAIKYNCKAPTEWWDVLNEEGKRTTAQKNRKKKEMPKNTRRKARLTEFVQKVKEEYLVRRIAPSVCLHKDLIRMPG